MYPAISWESASNFKIVNDGSTIRLSPSHALQYAVCMLTGAEFKFLPFGPYQLIEALRQVATIGEPNFELPLDLLNSALVNDMQRASRIEQEARLLAENDEHGARCNELFSEAIQLREAVVRQRLDANEMHFDWRFSRPGTLCKCAQGQVISCTGIYSDLLFGSRRMPWNNVLDTVLHGLMTNCETLTFGHITVSLDYLVEMHRLIGTDGEFREVISAEFSGLVPRLTLESVRSSCKWQRRRARAIGSNACT